MHRRAFLKRSLVAGGVTTVAGAGYLGLSAGSALPKPRRWLTTLDEVPFGVLALVAGQVLPFEGADPIEVAHGVDEALRYASPEAQHDLQLVLSVLEYRLSGLLTRGGFTLFSELTPEGRDAALHRWGDSSVSMLRGATNSIRKLCLGTFYAPLEHARAIGYPGPVFEKPSPPPIVDDGPLSPPYVPKVKAAAEGEEEAQ